MSSAEYGFDKNGRRTMTYVNAQGKEVRVLTEPGRRTTGDPEVLLFDYDARLEGEQANFAEPTRPEIYEQFLALLARREWGALRRTVTDRAEDAKAVAAALNAALAEGGE